MSRVDELQPGDLVTIADRSAVFLASCQHPVWPHLSLVIWRLDDDSVSLDALDPRQEVGDVTPTEPPARMERLMDALLTADQVMRHGIGLRRRT